ncbi:MAG TPA: hypothetical protein VHZ09_01465 [Acidobacteriaceae bacterium]|jgi:hypothetical protein|nr:hypothetical protein [Acidobacteriaceae bacterium]
MRKKGLQFYHRYSDDGSCKVICLNCYATLGIGPDRAAVAGMEAAHVCGEWVPAAERGRAMVEAERTGRRRELSELPLLERIVMGVHPAILLPAIAILLYALPTALEILARSQLNANTWVAVILPGDAVGCAVLIVLAKKPRAGLLLYCALTSLECLWHLTHVMRGVTMAWVADLVPTVAVILIVLMRLQKVRGLNETAYL